MRGSSKRRGVLFIAMIVLICAFFPLKSDAMLMFSLFGGASDFQCPESGREMLWGGALGGSTNYISFSIGGLYSNCNETTLFGRLTVYLINSNGFKAGIGANVDVSASNYAFKALRPEAAFQIHLTSVGETTGPDPSKHYPAVMAWLEGRIGILNSHVYGTIGITFNINPLK